MTIQINGARLQAILFALVMLIANVQCRQWQSIVDHSIAHRSSNFDSSRYELKIEADPFFSPGDQNPTEIPTEAPKVEADNTWTTVDIEAPPSMVPMTMAPSKFNIEQNGGCSHGFKPYEIHMMDTWGDGWDQTMITITGMSGQDAVTSVHANSQGGSTVSISQTIELDSSNPNSSNPDQIFQGTLQDGYHDSSDICLSLNRCYEIIATGSEFAEEVSWELRMSTNDMEPMLTGGAPTRCTFSIPDVNGHHICSTVCSEPVTEAPVVEKIVEPIEAIIEDTMEETETPTFTPTEVQAEIASDAFLSSMLARSGAFGGSSATSLLENLKHIETEIPTETYEQVTTNDEVDIDEPVDTDEESSP
eukprot:CAMPEP_0197174240 /NCGR_PEP_ID=MMETSP1423-20130617/850_1 /TAXON_ID=476441 /ORGANISM="Pseudo-nitzschia heimii, Strain UNC1101" /LENGTH=361 /DNA_ID=CAMNT_0042623149 /DNA_START=104 /DNA_END=1189 /DNA_ORIENTATION=+